MMPDLASGTSREPLKTSFAWHAATTGLLALVLLADVLTPVGVAVPLLYLIPTVLFIGAARSRAPLVIAGIATALTIAGFFLSPPGGNPVAGLVNRTIILVVIWVTAAFVVAYARAVDRWNDRMASAHGALQTLVRRLQDMQHALDQSSIVAATDRDGAITYVNDQFCEISKYSREELIGQDHRIVSSGTHQKEFIRDLWRTISQGRIWRGELRNKAKDGSFYWVDTTIVPFLDDRGEPWQYMAIHSNITKRKAAEQTLLDQAALAQLGRLSAVVAHEVRNPLAALKGSLQVLARRLPADFSGREIIAPMMARIDTLNSTVRDILTYSRPAQPKLQRFELTPILADAAAAAPAADTRANTAPASTGLSRAPRGGSPPA
ncbi:MAG: PAS domain S-box protein, partial [Acidobacteriota bacterium]